MMSILEVNGHKAKITYDPEIEMLRGEILGLSGGADFYATSIDNLKTEFENSLKTYLEVCEEQGIEPYKTYSGKLPYRTDAEKHQLIEAAAASEGLSINKYIDKTISEALIMA